MNRLVDNPYFILLKAEFKKTRDFKANFAAQCLFIPIKLLILILFWTAIFKHTTVIQGFELNDMILYYFGIHTTSYFINPFCIITYDMYKDITTGNMDLYLTKPLSYFLIHYISKLHHYIFGSLIFLGISSLLKEVGLVNVSYMNLIFIVFFILLSCTLLYLMFLTIGILTFYLKNTLSLRDILWAFIRLLCGTLLPLEFYPKIVLNVLEYLPFKYIYYTPSMLLIKNINMMEIVKELVIIFIWITLLIKFNQWLWRKAVKKNTALGG